MDGLDHLPQQRWHDISHIPSNHLTKVEHQTSFFYHLRYNRSLFVVHKEATGISNELWDVKIRRTASTFGSLATCFGIPGCRSVWVAPCIWKSYITCVCIVQHTIKACFSFGFQNNAWRPLRATLSHLEITSSPSVVWPSARVLLSVMILLLSFLPLFITATNSWQIKHPSPSLLWKNKNSFSFYRSSSAWQRHLVIKHGCDCTYSANFEKHAEDLF